MDAALLWRDGLRRSAGLCEILAHHLHQECEDAGLRLCRRARHRMPGAADAGILARAARSGRAGVLCDLSRRRPRPARSRAHRRSGKAHAGVVGQVSEVTNMKALALIAVLVTTSAGAAPYDVSEKR